MRPFEASAWMYSPTGLPYSGCRLVAAITRWSGLTPRKARSKVARLTPLACASGHSLASNAANECLCVLCMRGGAGE